MARHVVFLFGLALFACASEPEPSAQDAGIRATDVHVDIGRDDDSGVRFDGSSTRDSGGDSGVDNDGDSGADAGAARTSLIEGAHEVLFVGNSYIFVNDVSGRYRNFATQIADEVRVEAATSGGYRFQQHAADLEQDGTAISALRTSSSAFEAVILQEQSQIGGLPEGGQFRSPSVAAARDIATVARDRGTAVVLYMTWGRRDGDPMNPGIFGTFSDMQDRLTDNYLDLADHLRTHGATARVAPVGEAFRTVFGDVRAAGEDPRAPGSDFHALYEPDGSHPSAQGAYLAACVLFGTITGRVIQNLADASDLDAEDSARLRDVCQRTLDDERWQPTPLLLDEQQIVLTDLQSGSQWGRRGVLSGDGQHLASTLFGLSGVSIHTRTATSWRQEGLLMRPEGIFAPRKSFGFSMALDDAGEIAIVGDFFAQVEFDERAGYTYLYTRTATTWTYDTTLERSVVGEDHRFGSAVAVTASGSIDGARIAVGAPSVVGSTVPGRAFVYVRSGDTWREEAVFDGPGDSNFGFALAIDDAGRTLVVGAPPYFTNRPGVVRIYRRDGGRWTMEDEVDAGSGIEDGFGSAVSLSAAGDRMVVGAPVTGRVYVVERDNGSWRVTTELAPHRPLDGSGSLSGVPAYGQALALGGNRVLIGASQATHASGVGAGSVLSFVESDGAFRFEGLLASPVVGRLSRFGESVTLSTDGKSAVVGAPFHNPSNMRFQVGVVHSFDLP